jgi:SAM-dependent methyltransferase
MACVICGSDGCIESQVLWPELIADWALAPHEVAYIDRQQGKRCSSCGSNLRSQVLGKSIATALGLSAPLAASIRGSDASILELNEAGNLHAVLEKAPNAVYGAYPEVDMQALPFDDGSFDLVVHSDTLEHIPHPLRALSECHRVLRPGGVLCYTVPVIVERLSRRRDGLPPSYHGAPGDGRDDHLVISEYGADMWTEPLRAGFSSVEVFAIDFPDALAVSARRTAT